MNRPVPRPIQQLPENVIQKIAAGEVVERPVSVVKELVENSLDAWASRIEVEIGKGGIDHISVTDDGIGIDPREMSLALTRHATSKIRSAEEIFSLRTLGFRGEALPSIASVSDFRLESATAESDPVGYVLEVVGGKQSTLRETALPRGTRVVVEKLFCTTPARLKFLKRPETEWGHIADVMTSLALGNLGIEWRVSHNGKKFLFCPVAKDLKSRALDIFGRDTVEALYPVERKVSEIEINGLISHPSFSKRSNRHLFVYVNGRYVQDRLINHAILSGYRTLLMNQQYPMVILNLEVDPNLVDVNVHPTKREIRFSNSNTIHHLISETIHRTLESAPWKDRPGEESDEAVFGGTFNISSQSTPYFEEKLAGPLPRPQYGEDKEGSYLKNVQTALEDFTSKNLPHLKLDSTQKPKIGTLPFSSLQLIGQFSLTYLICEHEGSLILIDQHAAHERIGFEKLKSAFADGGLSQQKLLHPISFDLSPADAERLRSCLDSLEKFALLVDEFGENSFVIKAHPTLIKNCDWVSLLRELVDKMEPEDKTIALEEKIDRVLATMACHRQIRAKDRLERDEMVELLRQLEGTPRSYHCPHGRPVMVEIEGREIEKWFKRVL